MWYAYAVCSAAPGLDRSWPSGLTPDLKVQLLWPAPDVCVVASDVPDALFQPTQVDGEEKPSPAEDPEWVSAAALAHHEVVQAAHQRADALPLRFGTVFRNETELLSHFGQIVPGLRQRLAQIAGCEEVEITLQLNRLAFETALDAQPRGARRNLDEELQKLQVQLWAAFEAAVSPDCKGMFQHSGNTIAFLLKRDSDLLVDFIRNGHNRAEWLELEVSGVWPPYSFAGGELVVTQPEEEAALAAPLVAAVGQTTVEHQLS